MNPKLLDQVLKSLSFPSNPAVLVDTRYADDAGIYKLNEDTAMVHSLDFFTPIVDDPYIFGQIAAANALSDIYAMGAKPLNALNIMCFPDEVLDHEVFQAILQGGIDKMHEAGVVVLGGHSIRDNELKYGLAVNGIVHPEKIITNHSLRPGDVILLTKPIGTGILSTALKNGILSEKDISGVIDSMKMLNNQAADLFSAFQISACTDVTGFGLLGHLWEMVQNTGLSIRLDIQAINFFERTIEFARNARHIPGGTLANIEYILPALDTGSYPAWYQLVLCDPQTSGGLLIGLAPGDSQKFVQQLSDYPFPVTVIGKVEQGANKIFLV